MGNTLTSEERRNIKREIYTLYPGLEQQLEMAFTCHDFEGHGTLPYAQLEPVVRHLLMQYGLIEYVTRFSSESGALDSSHVRNELAEFGVSPNRLFGSTDMHMDEFKSLAVVWLKKILDTHADDQAEWMEKLREEQEIQSENYAKAMQTFQEQYTNQQSMYQQGLDEQQRQIQDWNKLLMEAQKTQQQVYDDEVRRMQEIQEREATAAQRAAQQEAEIVEKYQTALKDLASQDTSGKCFVYPSSITPYGACASAGAQEPTRRKMKYTHRAAKGCC